MMFLWLWRWLSWPLYLLWGHISLPGRSIGRLLWNKRPPKDHTCQTTIIFRSKEEITYLSVDNVKDMQPEEVSVYWVYSFLRATRHFCAHLYSKCAAFLCPFCFLKHWSLTCSFFKNSAKEPISRILTWNRSVLLKHCIIGPWSRSIDQASFYYSITRFSPAAQHIKNKRHQSHSAVSTTCWHTVTLPKYISLHVHIFMQANLHLEEKSKLVYLSQG